jgi:4-hydroxybenzoate polyprenyltransferase
LNFFKRFLDFTLFGNIYVSLGTACLIQSSIVQLGYSDHLKYYTLLSFFATLFIYNLQRIFYTTYPDKSQNSIRRKWIKNNQNSIKLLTIIGFIGVCSTFFQNDWKLLLYLFPLFILSLAYFLPFIKLRQNAWFKLLTLAIVWTMVTAVLPILLNGLNPFSRKDLLHIFVRFCFMTAICIPFDIRDLAIDRADSVSTLPHLYGENKTRKVALFFMLVYFLLIVAEYCTGMLNSNLFLGLFISALITVTLVFMSSSKRSEYFYVLGIDGTMILQGIIIYLIHLF